jgi:hypothetical protein
MFQRKTLTSLAFVLALAAVPAIADESQHDQHHPVGSPAADMPSGMPGAGMEMRAAAGGMPMMGMMRMMGAHGMAMMAEHVEGRIAFLKAELKITDAQAPQWNAFADAMRDNAKAMQGMMEGGMMGMGQDGTMPDKLAAREKQLTARLDAIRKLKAAADPLYAALSADQKKTADEIMISPMGMMM